MGTVHSSLVEKLEKRQFLSVTTPTLSLGAGVLRVAGTDFNDTITVGLTSDHTHVEVKVTNVEGHNIDDVSTPVAGLTRIRIHGLAGDDAISVDTSNGPLTGVQMVVFGDAGNDNIGTGDLNSLIYGGPGDDVFAVGNGNNILLGGGGADHITAGDGKNLIFGGFGDDVVVTGNGNSFVDGGPGSDNITVGNGNNVVFGGAGDDVIMAGTGKDILFGGFGNDHITTTSSQARIFGGPGNDVINGVLGDTIWGGDGADTITPAPATGNHIHEGEPPAIAAIENLYRVLFLF